MNSPIKWVGGKKGVKDLLISLFPPHEQYVEVFGGAGWVLLSKEQAKTEILNDINSELINFYKVIHNEDKCNELIEKSSLTPKSREIYEEWDSLTKEELSKLSDVDRALRLYFMLKLTFAGRINRKKNTFLVSTDGRKQINYGRFPTEFIDLHNRIKDVFIENKDFEYILKKYDNKGKRTLFYLDPPYLETTEDDYGTSFNLSSYKRLKDCLDSVEGNWILTCNDKRQLRDLFSEYNILNNDVYYGISASEKGRRKYNELIITNFEKGVE